MVNSCICPTCITDSHLVCVSLPLCCFCMPLLQSVSSLHVAHFHYVSRLRYYFTCIPLQCHFVCDSLVWLSGYIVCVLLASTPCMCLTFVAYNNVAAAQAARCCCCASCTCFAVYTVCCLRICYASCPLSAGSFGGLHAVDCCCAYYYCSYCCLHSC